MNASLVALTVFLALVTASGALLLLARDLCSPRGGSGRGKREPGKAPVRLRRLPRVPNDSGSGGLLSRFDHWFLRLIRESGLSMTPTEAALLLVLCGTIVGAALFVWNEQPLVAAVGVTLGTGTALAGFVIRRRRRVKLLQDQLPAALDMLARAMRAGQSLDEAVEMVGRESPEPLAREFRFAANQLAMGLSMPAVMRSLVDRVQLFDMSIFTTTLTVHRQSGGNVAKVLQRLAAVIRERLAYRRQLRATTGAGRLSAGLIAVIGPLLFLYMFIFHPQYVQAMLESPVGQAMLITAVALQAVGLVWTARLLKPVY